MRNRKLRREQIGTLTRQCLNCWLGYVLSQPVDIDLTVFAYLVKDYIGVMSFTTFFNRSYSTVSVTGEKKEKTFEEVIA